MSTRLGHQLLTADPPPPQQVLVWGFPGEIGFTLEEQRPIGRVGIVAMAAREPYVRLDNVLRDEKVILFDARTFPGNSGGPVFDHPPLGRPFRLAGLISAGYIAASLAIAEPVSRIAEALEIAYQTETKVRGSRHSLQRPMAD
jgi:S1-C subfamily serine protease